MNTRRIRKQGVPLLSVKVCIGFIWPRRHGRGHSVHVHGEVFGRPYTCFLCTYITFLFGTLFQNDDRLPSFFSRLWKVCCGVFGPVAFLSRNVRVSLFCNVLRERSPRGREKETRELPGLGAARRAVVTDCSVRCLSRQSVPPVMYRGRRVDECRFSTLDEFVSMPPASTSQRPRARQKPLCHPRTIP